jgi:hypothetical protein
VCAGLVADGGAEQDLWQASLHVDGPDGAAVRWIGARVLGRGPSAGARSAAQAADEAARGRALRVALQGANVVVVVLDAASALHVGGVRVRAPHDARAGPPRARGSPLRARLHAGPVHGRSDLLALDLALPGPAPPWDPARRASPARARPAGRGAAGTGSTDRGLRGEPSAGRPYGLDRGFAEFRSIYETGGGSVVRRAEELRESLERFLDGAGGGRFFAYVHHLQPHFPYDPPPPFDRAFGTDRPLPRSARTDDAWLRRLNAGEARLPPEEQAHLVRRFVTGRFKAQWSVRMGSLTLHDLEADPGESADLAARLPVRAEAMRQRIARFLRDLRREPAAPVEEKPSPADEEMLRALGYVR